MINGFIIIALFISELGAFVFSINSLNASVVLDLVSVFIKDCCDRLHYMLSILLEVSEGLLKGLCDSVDWLYSLDRIRGGGIVEDI